MLGMKYMKFSSLLILTLFSLPLFASTIEQKVPESSGPGYHFTGFDADLDGGIFLSEGSPFGGRLRIGGVKAVDDLFYFAGATVGYSKLLGVAGGLEVEALSLQTGLWAQLGILASENHLAPFLKGSVGWSLVGFDLYYLPQALNEESWMAMLKLRVPLSLIGLALTR
jgi:hypothetical protein